MCCKSTIVSLGIFVTPQAWSSHMWRGHAQRVSWCHQVGQEHYIRPCTNKQSQYHSFYWFMIHAIWCGDALKLYKKGHFTLEHENLWPLKSKTSCWWVMARLSHFTSHYNSKGWMTKEVWMDKQTYMDSYMTRHVWCFMVYPILHQSHLNEVGLTQIWENTTLRISTPWNYDRLLI